MADITTNSLMVDEFRRTARVKIHHLGKIPCIIKILGIVKSEATQKVARSWYFVGRKQRTLRLKLPHQDLSDNTAVSTHVKVELVCLFGPNKLLNEWPKKR